MRLSHSTKAKTTRSTPDIDIAWSESAAAMSRMVSVLGVLVVSIAMTGLFWLGFKDYPNSATVGANEKIAAKATGPINRLDPAREMPAFRFVDESDREHTLEDFSGKVVLLNIWATWCPPCRREMPSLDRLQTQMGGSDFQVVAISTDREGTAVVRSFYQQLDIRSLKVFADYKGEAERELKVPGLPTTMLIDRFGHAIGVKIGPWEWDSEEMIALIVNELKASPGN